MMEAPQAIIAPSRTGKAACKQCAGCIQEGEMRVTIFSQSAFHDGYDGKHFHATWLLNLPWREQLIYSADEAQKEALRMNVEAQAQNEAYVEMQARLRACRPIDVKALVEEAGYAVKDGCKLLDGGTLEGIAADGLAFGALGPCTVCGSVALRHAGHGQGAHAMTWCEGYYGTAKCEFVARGAWSPVERRERWSVSAALRKGAPRKQLRAVAESADAACGRAPPEEDAASASKKRKKGEAEEEEDNKAEGGAPPAAEGGAAAAVELREVPADSELRKVDDLALQEVFSNIGARGASVHVSHGGRTAWTCSLISVDAKTGENKFYKMQLLIVGQGFALFTRWGRVGDGDSGTYYAHESARLNKCMLHAHDTLAAAIKEFVTCFRRHTDNDWHAYAANRAFSHKPGCYDLVRHADAEPAADEPASPEKKRCKTEEAHPTTTTTTTTHLDANSLKVRELQELLTRRGVVFPTKAKRADLLDMAKKTTANVVEPEAGGSDVAAEGAAPPPLPPGAVRDFIQLIFSKRMIEAELAAREVDVSKFPLGELSEATITAAYAALSRASAVVDGDVATDAAATDAADWDDAVAVARRKTEISAATNDFLRAIPHVVPKGAQRALRLSTQDLVRQKLELVDALKQILIRLRLDRQKQHRTTDNTRDAGGGPEAARRDAQVTRQYAALRCNLEPVDRDSEEHRHVEAYLRRGLAGSAVVQLFRAARAEDANRFAKFQADADRRLLWHGSGLPNWAGILSQGLKIAPPDAPHAGYNFDKGVYFADAAGKSAQYCRADGGQGILLLADVACGDPLVKYVPDFHANGVRQLMAKDSVFAPGMTRPDEAAGFLDLGGAKVPLGDLVDEPRVPSVCMHHNEFIVYDEARVKIRYVLQASFDNGDIPF